MEGKPTKLSRYETTQVLKGGIEVLIRPIRPDDAKMEREFIESLGSEAIFFRFFGDYEKPTPEMIQALCNIDYEKQMALIAETSFDSRQGKMIIGVVRLIETTGSRGEFAVVVADRFQSLGLGEKLIEMILRFANDRELVSVYAAILPENQGIINLLLRRFGFIVKHADTKLVIVELLLKES